VAAATPPINKALVFMIVSPMRCNGGVRCSSPLERPAFTQVFQMQGFL
jgi:hypothetical protein